jgi:lipoprotein-anchoring transpeptidase ErfK/SrfK
LHHRTLVRSLALAIPLVAACSVERAGSGDSTAARVAAAPVADSARPAGESEDPFAADTLGLAQFAEPGAADSARRAALFAAITPEAVNRASGQTAAADSLGPDVLHVQVQLDQAGFSPGIMDGYWGHNSTTALRAFQAANNLPVTGTLSEAGRQRLSELGAGRTPVVRYTVTDEDVKGPFVKLPESPYEKAKLDCLCYESAAEALSEKFHSTPQLLSQLNGGVDVATARAGTQLWVPDVQRAQQAGTLARVVVFKRGGFMQGIDSTGKVLFHFPSTLGNQYDPSPTGDFRIERVARNPEFHYNPKLYAEVPDWKEDAMLRPGPNSPVGVVWMALNEPHYGIHGTSDPQTIGYASSHGCIRLTNWDAAWLADHVAKGTQIAFR